MNASTILDKVMILGALDKCLAHQPHKASAIMIDPLLAFGVRRPSTKYTPAQETEFRLYARLAIGLLGYVSFPAQLKEATRLKEELNTARYSNLEHAKAQFSKYKGIAAAVQYMSPAAIIDIEKFADRTNMSEYVVSDRINNAVKVGIRSIRESIRRLKANDQETQGQVLRWFGKGAEQKLLANFETMLARATDPMNPIFITYEDQDVFGTSSFNSRSINLGKKFFSDEHTVPKSNLARGYIARDYQIENVKEVTALNDQLNRKYRLLTNIEFNSRYYDPTLSLADVIARMVEDAKATKVSGVVPPTKEEYANAITWAGSNMQQSLKAALAGLMIRSETQFNREKANLVAKSGDLSKMEVTAFGIFVHELTHMVLSTQDLDSSCIDVPGQVVYGPLLCQMVATKNSALALNNADNYRHFAECWVRIIY